jgi:hypothetical protein
LERNISDGKQLDHKLSRATAKGSNKKVEAKLKT